MTSTNFNELTKEVQDKIKNYLKIYDEADVYFENGEYHFGLVLKSSYADDHKVIGTYKAKEIFTEEERIVNYIESFHEYPIFYKGKRDYRMLNEIKGNWDVKFELVDGNLEIVK